jgi:predicted metallopeptidase
MSGPRPSSPLQRVWTPANPPPVAAMRSRTHPVVGPLPALDLSAALHRLVADIAEKLDTFWHLKPERIAFGLLKAKNRHKHGLQARVTAMRAPGGRPDLVENGRVFRAQRYTIHGHDILYLMEFALPRFFNGSFEAKIATVVHEMFHISPAFDGDLRRFEGRYSTHTHDKDAYHEKMIGLSRLYLERCADESSYEFLKSDHEQLCAKHGYVFGLSLPRPRLVLIADAEG